MDNVITYKNGKSKTGTVGDAMQRMEDEGGIVVTLPPEIKPSPSSRVIQRLRKMLKLA